MEYKKQPVIKTQYQFLTGNVLKWIAAVSMTVDHIAAVVLKGYVRTNLALLSDGQVIRWKMLYHSMRSAGRTAFPLFAFLLVEGFLHTKDRKNMDGVCFSLRCFPKYHMTWPYRENCGTRRDRMYWLRCFWDFLCCALWSLSNTRKNCLSGALLRPVQE